jgi:hypothetical protein
MLSTSPSVTRQALGLGRSAAVAQNSGPGAKTAGDANGQRREPRRVRLSNGTIETYEFGEPRYLKIGRSLPNNLGSPSERDRLAYKQFVN